MFKKIAYATAAAVAFAASPAMAATLVGVTIQGTVVGGDPATGTVWDTVSNGYYTAFVQQTSPVVPFVTVYNPNDEALSAPVVAGTNNFAILGEGWVPGLNVNSDVAYRLTLNFSDGATISGLYTFAGTGGVFTGGTSATVGSATYTLRNFGWDRQGADVVSANSYGAGGDPNDYSGLFSFTATGVPEPTAWALFILGFGVIGHTMRRRSSKVRVAKASLNFA